MNDHHGSRRLKRIGATGIITLAARAISLSVSLLSLPLTSHYLGKERYGLWLMLVGLVNWTGLADLGLANSLIGALSTADGQNDLARARQIVASACWLSAFVSISLLVLLVGASWLIEWSVVFNLNSRQAIAESRPAVMVLLVCFALRLLTGVLSSIYVAYQEGYVYQLWNVVCSLLSAGGLIAAIRWQGGLPWLVGLFVGGWLLGEIFSALYLFGWRRPEIKPAWGHFNGSEARALLRNGAQLWIAQMTAVLLLQTDLLVVTRLFGAQSVAAYGTSLRLFNFIGAAQAAFTGPLWAAYSEAFARRDTAWLRQTFRRSLWLSVAFSVPAGLFVVFAAPWLFSWLVTADVRPERGLLWAMFATEVVHSAARCIAMLLNGLGAIRSQALFGPLAGLANLILSVVLGRWLGVAGVAWATAICLFGFWLILLGSEARLRLQQLD